MAPRDSRLRSHPFTAALITILILVTIFGALYVPMYAREAPKVGAFPFFYFYLMIYMPGTGIVMWIVYLLQKRLASPESEASQ